MPGMTLTLITRPQSAFLPDNTATAHWSLYLWDPDLNIGTVYQVAKESYFRGNTVTNHREMVRPQDIAAVSASVVVASGLHITHDVMRDVCRRVAYNRPFDLVRNNCQRYCMQVLQELVTGGHLDQHMISALWTKGFTPLIGNR
ncbi:hypothetical protein C8Q77DRAFT_1104137 [Trametes polyzona]|nr:hypothetical protein C8Q77DRAFT_1104137 [Trametes polyzona]